VRILGFALAMSPCRRAPTMRGDPGAAFVVARARGGCQSAMLSLTFAADAVGTIADADTSAEGKGDGDNAGCGLNDLSPHKANQSRAYDKHAYLPHPIPERFFAPTRPAEMAEELDACARPAAQSKICSAAFLDVRPRSNHEKRSAGTLAREAHLIG